MTIHTKDPYTNRPRVLAVRPRFVPRHVSTWRDRMRARGDVLLFGAFAVLMAFALLTGVR